MKVIQELEVQNETSTEWLRQNAEDILGKDVLEQIEEWYKYSLEGIWKYVVFVVRRSYLLALISEKLTGKRMFDTEQTSFLTDAAFFLRCEEMADYFREKMAFPPILLCDDILIHGRNINHFLKSIEMRLCGLLEEYSDEEVKCALREAVRIHVHTKAVKHVLIDEEYESSIHYIRREEPNFWRNLSSNISSLILYSGMANAVYVFSQAISQQDFEKIPVADYCDTMYQGIKQHTIIRYLGNGVEKKAIFTLRMIENVGKDGYRVIPFVFLPNLNEYETQQILHNIFKSELPEEIKNWLLQLERIEGKRSFNEVLTLVLSNIILIEFNNKYGIQRNESDYNEEITKLVRNYNGVSSKTTKFYLETLISKKYLKISELSYLFEEEFSPERKVLVLDASSEIRFEEKQIKEDVEDYFYERGYREEKIAIDLATQSYFPTVKRSERYARGCCFTLLQLYEKYTRREIDYGIAYFLQMMDAGVLSISSYAPNGVRVVGFAQFAKAGEQSLLVKPLRMYEYIPMLTQMQYESQIHNKQIVEEFDEYCDSHPEFFSDYEKKEILDFIHVLEPVDQMPEDWDGQYMLKLDFAKSNMSKWVNEVLAFSKKRRFFRESYIQYVKERY